MINNRESTRFLYAGDIPAKESLEMFQRTYEIRNKFASNLIFKRQFTEAEVEKYFKNYFVEESNEFILKKAFIQPVKLTQRAM